MASILWGLPAFNALLLLCVFWYENKSIFLSRSQAIVLLVLGVLTATTFYLWYCTYYVIENYRLRYKAGFFSGSIDIRTIVSVIPSNYPLSGNRPAMSMKGLLIRY